MQSFSGQATYFCSDCKKQFSSASTLLNHFAQHITQKHDCQTQYSASEIIDSKQNNSLSVREFEKKSKSILEQVLKQSVLTDLPRIGSSSSPESNNQDSSSYASECFTSTASSDNDSCSYEENSQIPQSVVEIGNHFKHTTPASNLMLVKFDLQKRLENCILKLASKRDSVLENTSRPVPEIPHTMWSASGLLNSPDLTVSMATGINNADNEDFNPLKFCIVTMEEGEDKLDLDTSESSIPKVDSNTGLSKASSSRKQQVPKKILVNIKKKLDVHFDISKGEKISTPKKKYPCLVCCKVFGWSTDLKRHILTHTGERPFKCALCPATFTRNFLLQKHEVKQHQSSSTGSDTVKDTKVTDVGGTTSTLLTVDECPPVRGKTVQACSLVRKRKLQRTISGKVDNNNVEKRFQLHQHSPNSIGLFTQQALNIS